MSKRTERIPDGRYEIGKIVGSHGIKGDITILPLTDFPDRFTEMQTLDAALPGKPMRTYKICRIEPYQGKSTFLAHLEGINDRDMADALRGASVTVAKEDRVELEAGEFWYDDIIGISIVDCTSGETLGTVTEIIRTASNDAYVVKTPDDQLKAIPATDEVILDINVAKRTMTVKIPEGLWD